jgi:hypothetical protein
MTLASSFLRVNDTAFRNQVFEIVQLVGKKARSVRKGRNEAGVRAREKRRRSMNTSYDKLDDSEKADNTLFEYTSSCF